MEPCTAGVRKTNGDIANALPWTRQDMRRTRGDCIAATQAGTPAGQRGDRGLMLRRNISAAMCVAALATGDWCYG